MHCTCIIPWDCTVPQQEHGAEGRLSVAHECSRHGLEHIVYPQPLHHYRACGRPSCAPHNTYIHTYIFVSSTRTRVFCGRVSPYRVRHAHTKASTAQATARIIDHTYRMAWVRPRGLFESGERGGARASARVLVVGRSGSVDSELSKGPARVCRHEDGRVQVQFQFCIPENA